MTLDDLKTGERGRVIRIIAKGPFKQRLLDLGFTAGTLVDVVKYAPLLDPIEYVVKGYHISLRHEEAALILVEPV